MAGGTWLSQNKVRPGAYINFKSVPRPTMTVGDRGIVAVPLTLHWGEEGALTEVFSSDLLDGASRKAVGFTAFDEESKLLAAALSYAYKALVFRMNTGGERASAEIGNLVCTARHTGTFGNRLVVTVDEEDGVYTVITYADGETMDTQKVTQISELEDNDYIIFSKKDGEMDTPDFTPTETAGTPLAGGTDGEADESRAFQKFLSALQSARYQTMCCFSSDTSVKKSVQSFIKGQRDDEGRYVQGVLADYDGADCEGIINVANGVVVDGVSFSKEDAVAIAAGMTAGANFNQSNTAREVSGATSVIGEITDISAALQKGKFLFSTSTSGKVKVEQDINSLHTFTKAKDYNFSKNRVLRTLDEIGTTTKQTWEDTYMGKVDNNDTGRGLFKADLVEYGKELQRLSGIQEFSGSDDIEIAQGNDLDAVLVTWAVKPVDSMEKLYMTVNVRG